MSKFVTFGLKFLPSTQAGMTTSVQDSQGVFYMLLELDEVSLMSGSWEKLFQTIIGSLSLKSFE